MISIWPRILQVCLREFCQKFKLKEIELDPALFDNEIETFIEGATGDWKLFEKFNRSYLIIELIRALKFSIGVSECRSQDFLDEFRDWLLATVLDDDEDKYYQSILLDLDPTRKWDKQYDQNYFDGCISSWEKQKVKIQEYLIKNGAASQALRR